MKLMFKQLTPFASGSPFLFVNSESISTPMKFVWQHGINDPSVKNIIRVNLNSFVPTCPLDLQGTSVILDSTSDQISTPCVTGMYGEKIEFNNDICWQFILSEN
jgi:hypothetical protein